MIGNKLYDKLKFVALIILPAAAAGYFSLSSVWGLPYAEQVVGTATILDTFLGVVLGVSSAGYKRAGDAPGTEGDLMVREIDGETYMSLGINKGVGVDGVTSKDFVKLRVVKFPPTTEVSTTGEDGLF